MASTTKIKNVYECDKTDNKIQNATCHFLGHVDSYIRHLQVFIGFSAIWTLFFIIAIDQFTIAGSFSTYYWTRKKTEFSQRTPLKSMLLTIR